METEIEEREGCEMGLGRVEKKKMDRTKGRVENFEGWTVGVV